MKSNRWEVGACRSLEPPDQARVPPVPGVEWAYVDPDGEVFVLANHVRYHGVDTTVLYQPLKASETLVQMLFSPFVAQPATP